MGLVRCSKFESLVRRCGLECFDILNMEGEFHANLTELHSFSRRMEQDSRTAMDSDQFHKSFSDFARGAEAKVLRIEGGTLVHVTSINDNGTQRANHVADSVCGSE